MAKSIYFFSKKKLNELLKMYGGGYRWTLHKELSEKNSISYMDKNGYMLTIGKSYEDGREEFSFVEVHISDVNGKIIRKDRFDFVNTDSDNIRFEYTEENGCFYDEFRKINVTMSKETKEAKIKKLEERLTETSGYLEQALKRNHEMSEQAENVFLNSPTHHQLQLELEFFKSLNKLNEIHLANAKNQTMRADEHLKQIYEDNKRMCEHHADTEYWAGITENWHEAKEYEMLREEIRELKGKITQKNQAIADCNDEIKRLQWIIAKDDDKFQLSISMERISQLELEVEKLKSTSSSPSDQNKIEELNKQIEKLQDDLRKSEGQCKVYQANVRKLSERREEISRTLGEARQKISELEAQRKSIFIRNSNPDIITMYHVLEDRTEKILNNLKKSKEETKKWKAMYQELNEKIAAPATPVKQKKPQPVGRPKTDYTKVQNVLKMRKDGKSMRVIANELGIALGTVSNIVKKYSK